MIKAILCVGRNGELGDSKRPDGLPWDKNPEDLLYFKDKTLHQDVLVGRNTYVGFQKMGMTKGLPNRRHFVITSRLNLKNKDHVMYVKDVSHLRKLLHLAKGHEDMWIIGGKSIYNQCMPYVEEVHITMIDKDFPEADTHMDLNFLREFELQSLTELNDYSIVSVYKRKK